MENSEFGKNTDFFALTDIVPLNNNGSTSDTYKVRISGKWHFLKRPKQEFANHPQYNAAFEKEFDIGYTLDHPNIVRYISKGKDKNGFYFLTEYVDGQTLKDFISISPTYFKKKEHVQKFVEQLLSAISYLHQKQILHLDLKPENILITNIGHDVKIIDLGFAYSDCYQFLTTGKTNLYAAPEQINNGKIDQRTDIYGIGMVLLYAFTQSTDKKQLSKIPPPYKSIVSKCLNDNIESRYFDVSSLNKEIVQLSKNKPVKYLLLLILLLGVGLFFFIKPYLTKETEKPNEQITISTDTVIEKKNLNSEPITVIAQPTVKEVSEDSFCNEFRGKAKSELLKIYLLKEPVSYSLENQHKRFELVREFYTRRVESVENEELKNKLTHIFWYEYMIIAFPYIREQFSAFLHKAKNEAIPDNITETGDVYKLIEKAMADKFIAYMNEYPIITTKEEAGKLARLFNEYDVKRYSIYNHYRHLFKSENEFRNNQYHSYYAFDIVNINNWMDIVDNWSRDEYRTDDNPYIKIRLK